MVKQSKLEIKYNLMDIRSNAKEYVKMKEYEKAKIVFAKGLKEYPNDIDLLYNMANVCKILEEYEEALKYYIKIIEISPPDCRTVNYIYSHKYVGDIYCILENYEEALKYYEKVGAFYSTAYDKNDYQIWGDYDYHYGEKGSHIKITQSTYNDLLDFLSKTIQLWQNNKLLYFYKGNLYRYFTEYEKALECYNKALDVDSKYTVVWCNKGNVYHNMKEYEKALECYNKALDVDSKYTVVWCNKGNVYHNMKEYEKALECYNKALDVDSENVIYLHHKAITLEWLGRYEKALSCYYKALKLYTGYSYILDNSRDTIDELIINSNDKGVSISYSFLWSILGDQYHEYGRYGEAIIRYDKAIKLNPNHIDALRHKAIALEKLGRYEEAKECYEQIKGMDMEETAYDLDYPLNQILYGPPGTGKTYNTIAKAVQIIDNLDENQIKEMTRNEIIQRYEELKENGQIEFITFHQSYSYEDFIEGINPETDEQGNISYIIKDGIFKEICNKALKNYKNSNNTNLNNRLDFKEAFEKLTEDTNFIDGETLKIETKQSYYNITDVTNTTIRFDKKNGSSKHSLCIATLKDMYNHKTTDKILTGGLKTYYDGLLNKLNNINEISENTPKKVENLKNYVLIIDEINRGNISKIFGELITLLEEDKRIGDKNEIRTTLPYSQDTFGVPNNLYIIGTMNTADRSIALIDTALRRRFHFEEIMPNSELLKDLVVKDINISKMLTAINQRIEYLYGRDQTIGHAYFMNLFDIEDEDEQFKELINIFENKIIPLLQEYSHENWENIQIILRDHYKHFKLNKELKEYDDELQNNRLIQSKICSKMDLIGFDHDDYEDCITYRVNPNINSSEAFIKIYDGNIIKDINKTIENKENKENKDKKDTDRDNI
ncbi:tetratricopeptide repeat protein [Methanococcus voltae]|uniref:TPR repeat-containing protein n=1 Tax=Methanococcus voltae (strain ATCC BAA-1334 / A3) TaxID=456320 RepID=D7DSU4_METV3|nr:tetratricopeptide repeat protein [Methanococcus voltae]MCS3901805.1 5-methylcytosine-specific restriction protein B [Methanococcus voltae]